MKENRKDETKDRRRERFKEKGTGGEWEKKEKE